MKLLLVDDNATLLELMTSALRFNGLEVVTASNGVEALELFDDTIDTILTDINMPVMNGFELLEEVKKLKPDFNVYVMSALCSNVDKAKELGAAGFFYKGNVLPEDVYRVISNELTNYF